MKWTLVIDEVWQGGTTFTILADGLEAARKAVESELEEWVCDGENGGPVAARWRLHNEEGRDIAVGCATTESEPDRGALIWSVGGAPSCKHEWIADDEGGLEATGGAWGLSERLMEIRQHCRWCGLHRVQRTTAAEKAPVKHYTVVYTQPES